MECLMTDVVIVATAMALSFGVVLALVALLITNATRTTNYKLDVIHTLVNSNMTAAMQAELDATVRQLALMREVTELKKTAGHDPSEETLAALELTRVKISELRAVLRDRLRQATLAEQLGER